MATAMKTSQEILKVYKRRARYYPALPDDMIFEILVRLPVKSLTPFKSVSKAWRATISDTSFICSHLQQSAKNNQEWKTSFLITPITLEDKVINSKAWPTNVSNHLSFYSWQEGQGEARHVHSTTFHDEFGSVYEMLHCDGLIVLSTDTKVYALNPAIHDVLKLPDGQEDVSGIPTVGFGLDPRTKKYKVVRFFYRHLDFSMGRYSMGTEIFTIGDDDIGSSWRSITEDPPLPIEQWSVIHFEGSLYLFVRDDLFERPSQGVLRFNLEDETFSFISYPEVFSPEEEQLRFIELGGELCLAQCCDGKQVIWVLLRSGEWAQHYAVILPKPWNFGILSVIPKDRLLIRSGNCLYHYDNARQDVTEVIRLDRLRYKKTRVGSFDFVAREDLFMFMLISYTESLFPVTKPRRHFAMYPGTAGPRMSDEEQPDGRRLCPTTMVTEASSEPMQRKSKRKKREAQRYSSDNWIK